jgi:hypothetical protein
MIDLMSLQGADYVIPKEKAHIVERLYRFCAQCQALEPQLPAYALATRLCGTFQSYVVGLGTKIVDDRKAEVGGAWRIGAHGCCAVSCSNVNIECVIILTVVLIHFLHVPFSRCSDRLRRPRGLPHQHPQRGAQQMGAHRTLAALVQGQVPIVRLWERHRPSTHFCG